MTPFLHIRLMGGFGLEQDGKLLPTVLGERSQALLAYLLLHRDTPQSRQHIAFRLWPDSPESHARSNLRSLLYQLRQGLPATDTLIDSTTQSLHWQPAAPVTVDLILFEEALAAAGHAERAGDPAVMRAKLQEALGHYGGELVPGSYEEWLEPHRERLRHRYAMALRQVAEVSEKMGDPGSATRYVERLIQHDPLDESNTILLMRLRAGQGDRAGVRRAYEKLGIMLQRELEVDPSPATRAAYEEWVQWESPVPAVPDPVPAPATVAPLSDHPAALPDLPARPTLLVGREEDLATVSHLLRSPAHRLVTLTGLGGMGKSTLALELAHRLSPDFTHGAAWVRLNAVEAPELLTTTVATALGLRFHPGAGNEEQLYRFLHDRSLLLVLDNFEQVLAGVGWLSTLLAHAPNITVLVTSRVRLDLQEEWVWEVGGLAAPTNSSPEGLEASSAAQLFRLAMQKGQRSFAWNSQAEQRAVAELCHRLGGMPLGLELAAAWGRLLSPHEILQELDQSLDFLHSDRWDLPSRHRSLRAVFEHSWALLDMQEQSLLRALSIFRDPFPREAAEQVAGATLLRLGSLLDSSLLKRLPDGRFVLHEAIRQYAAAQLAVEPAEEEAIRDQHMRFFARWVIEREWAIKGARQQQAIGDITAQINDIRMAWQRATEQGEVNTLGPMLGGLGWYYDMSGFLGEGAVVCRLAVEALRARGAPDRLTTDEALGNFAFLLAQAGWFAGRTGEMEAGLALLREGLRLGEQVADSRTRYHCHANLAYLLLYIGHLPEAEQHAEQALAVAWEYTGERGAAIALAMLGWLAYKRGDGVQAHDQLESSLALWRRVGDARGLAFTLNFMSEVAQARGTEKQIIPLLHESIVRSADIGDRWAQATTLNMLGQLTLRQKEIDKALAYFQQSQQLLQAVGEPTVRAQALLNQGHAARLLGQWAEAALALAKVLRLGEVTRNRPVQLAALLEIAAVRASAGDAAAALKLLLVSLPQAALVLPPAQLAPFEALRAELQARCPSEEVRAVEVEAAIQSVEGLVAAYQQG